MRLNNKSVWLSLALTGCVGGGGGDAPRLVEPDAAPPAAYAEPTPVDAPQTVTPLQPDEQRDGPPPSTGPSATSDRAPDRNGQVGLAAISTDGGYVARVRGMTAGSFVEVTSLQTGRITLATVDAGTPPANALAELGAGAANAIGAANGSGVRVRRVTPSPTEQTALTNGQAPSPRMDAPPALLAGLRAQLGGTAPPPPLRAPVVRTPTAPVRPVATARPIASKPVAQKGPGFYVQVAAFGSSDRATALARSIGGSVSSAGTLYRVRLGPYATADEAAKARSGVAARGYPDARVARDN